MFPFTNDTIIPITYGKSLCDKAVQPTTAPCMVSTATYTPRICTPS
jgi:hypothetical protein